MTRTADEETEDGRIRNKEAIAKIRDAWVYKQIRARVDEFTEYKQVSQSAVFRRQSSDGSLQTAVFRRQSLSIPGKEELHHAMLFA